MPSSGWKGSLSLAVRHLGPRKAERPARSRPPGLCRRSSHRPPHKVTLFWVSLTISFYLLTSLSHRLRIGDVSLLNKMLPSFLKMERPPDVSGVTDCVRCCSICRTASVRTGTEPTCSRSVPSRLLAGECCSRDRPWDPARRGRFKPLLQMRKPGRNGINQTTRRRIDCAWWGED